MPSPQRASLLHKLRVDAHAVWLSARDPRTPWHARLLGIVVAAYALSPIDLIPDFIPVIGLLDEAILIPAGIWLFLKLLPDGLFEEHRIEAESASHRPGSAAGAVLVVLLWIAAAAIIWRLWAWHYD